MTASGAAGLSGSSVRMSRIYSEKQRGLFGLWLFLASEGFLFTALLAARFYFLFSSPPVKRPDELNQGLGLALAAVLLVSSLTAFRAEALWRFGEQKRSQIQLLLTVLLGFIFLVGVGIEWAEGFHELPIGGKHASFASLFYMITGFHAFHVLTGIIAIIFALRMASKGQLAGSENWAVEGVVKYWHFVDVVWVFIYPALYLIN